MSKNDHGQTRQFERISVEIEGGTIAGWHSPANRTATSPSSENALSESTVYGNIVPGNQRVVNLIFCHATGFCAAAYLPMLGYLPPHVRIWAIDMRGHGRTALSANPAGFISWSPYVKDICALFDKLRHDPRIAGSDQSQWVLAGHSMGAASAMMAGAQRSEIAKVLMIEPVALPGYISMVAATPLWSFGKYNQPMVRNALRRRNGWPDRRAVSEAYKSKELFAAWADGCLEGYLEDGLKQIKTPEGQERYVLACDPAWEAATFAAQANPFWSSIRRLGGARAAVLAGRVERSTAGKSAETLFRRFGVDFLRVSDFDHLPPMTYPERSAQFLAGYLTLENGVDGA